jgi:predicted permease
LSKRIFEFLLSFYPSSFRDEYGREMTLLFVDRYREASGKFSRLGLWLEVLAGILIHAPRERAVMVRQDLHYAVRMLRKSPLFAAVIILTLALGIGANSAVFSLLNTVILRALPLADPQELFVLRIDSRVPPPQRYTWPAFEQLRAALPDGIAAMSRVMRAHTRGVSGGGDGTAMVQLVSGEYFDVLKVPMALGRPLMPDDNRTPGAHPVAVISHSYWLERYGGDPDVLGREISLNNARFTIVGVAAPHFAGVWLESPVQSWVPAAMQHDVRYSQNFSADNAELNRPWMTQDRIWWLDVVVRVPEGAEAKAAAALNGVFHQMLASRADRMGDPERRALFLQQRLVLQPFGHGFSALRQTFSKPLYVLMAMAAMVLLIACANTANLLLARAAGRHREIALRLSLGAGRLRLVQQLLTESLLLVAVAGVAAIFIAQWTGQLLLRMAMSPESAPLAVAADYKVLGFTAAVALLTGLMFGLAPALRSTKMPLSESLKGTARTVEDGSLSRTARSLVVVQIALSLVLVAGTGLLVRSLRNLLQFDPGFDREHVLAVWLNPQLTTYSPEQLPGIYRQIVERIESIPGVRGASLAMCGLVSGCRSVSSGFEVEGYRPAPDEEVGFLTNIVSPNYFATVGMPLVAGRSIQERDGRSAPRVAVVNETLARRYFQNGQAVGKRVRLDNSTTEIVGIVRDARVLNIKEPGMPSIFYALKQFTVTAGALDIRTTGNPSQVTAVVRRILVETAPHLPVTRVVTLNDQIGSSLRQERLVLSLTSAFGALALVLAGFGLFGVLSYAVARRTGEFGVRMALGASPGRIIRDILRDAMSMTLVGLMIGLAVVGAAAKAAASMLFGVSPHDAITMLGAMLFVVIGASLAGLFPALRAARVDPLVALRNE